MNKPTIQDQATIVQLSCSFNWGTITDKIITDEVNHDKHTMTKALRVRKTLLPAEAGVYVQALQTTLGGFYNGYHMSHTWATPTKGQRILPVVFYPEWMKGYGETCSRAKEKLTDLKDNYKSAIEKAKVLLGSGFNIDDYPPVDEIDQYLSLGVRWLPIPKGDHVASALGAGVASSVDQYVNEMQVIATDEAKQRLRKAVARMAERLQAKGKLYETVFTDIDELAQTLPVLVGITGDSELQTMVDEVRDTLSGYSAEDLRKNAKARASIGARADDILRRMGGV